ncbi:MAG: SDR family NAD(P)-dependent oxidoreductase, partial [Alistipes sp.]|nr:SDR family NAD(P)-dependent oxidoreductase [Alistipes sp.]
MFSLAGKNAWITGASYGIGFNIAKAFVAAGIKNIIFNDINEAALEKGLANYKEAGIENVHGYVCDVTNEDQVKEMVEKVHAEVGQIDILVNNAGIIKRIPMMGHKQHHGHQYDTYNRCDRRTCRPYYRKHLPAHGIH